MQEIKGYYNEIGLFETYVGEIFVSGNRLMLSIYNAILGIHHPLNKTNQISYLSYCIFSFNEAINSTREVYDNYSNFLFKETNYIKCLSREQKMNDFLLELIDINNTYQYWNWIITAKDFSIIIKENYRLRGEPFNYLEIRSLYEMNH